MTDPAPAGPAYIYRAVCDRVVDGDTVIANVDLGFNVHIIVPVRIRGVNAPEVHGPTKDAGLEAAEYLEHTLFEWRAAGEYATPFPLPLLIRSYKDARSFERWVCDIWTRNHYDTTTEWMSVADLIIEAGHGTRIP
jgi:hypothetical protein